MGKFGTRPDLTRQARVLMESGKAQDAKKPLQEAIDAFRGDAEAWDLLAVCHGTLGEYTESERCCLRAVDAEPRAYGSWGNLATALKLQGRVAEAEKACRRALKIEPRYAEGHNILGNLLFDREEFAEAEHCYRAALTLQPSYPDALANLGAALQQQGKIEEAIASFRRALTVQPRHANALRNLGSALITLGRLGEEAVQIFERLVDLHPASLQARWVLEDLYQQTQQYDRAIEFSNRVLSVDPNYAPSYFSLALSYRALHDYDKAESMFRKAYALDPKGMEHVPYFLATIGREPFPEKVPGNFVKELFNSFAERFDSLLVEKLAYQIPQLLNTVVRSVFTDPSVKLDILDLGCGTGLSGEPFRDIAHRLTGVDLSEKMIAKAKARAIYDELIVGDILVPLVTPNAAFDLIIAADVFVYLGDLEPVFRACKTALRSGGLFAFSTEAEDGEGKYVLRSSGRYAHTLSYLQALTEAAGFQMALAKRVTLRKESGQAVEGNLCVLQHRVI